MEGYVKLTAIGDKEKAGVAVEVELGHVGVMDKCALVHALTRGLQFSKAELYLLCEYLQSGFLDEHVERTTAAEASSEDLLSLLKKFLG